MQYVLITLALAATIVALAGDTLNKKRRGWRRITLQGYIALIAAISTACVSYYDTYIHSQNEVERSKVARRGLIHEISAIRGVVYISILSQLDNSQDWKLEFFEDLQKIGSNIEIATNRYTGDLTPEQLDCLWRLHKILEKPKLYYDVNIHSFYSNLGKNTDEALSMLCPGMTDFDCVRRPPPLADFVPNERVR